MTSFYPNLSSCKTLTEAAALLASVCPKSDDYTFRFPLTIEALLDYPQQYYEEAKTDAKRKEEISDLITHHFNTIFTHEEGKGIDNFNGHFWVELEDGSVLDDYDWGKEMTDYKKYMGIKRPSKTLLYERCDNPITNKVFLTLLERSLTQSGLTLDYAKKLFGLCWTPRRLTCMYNSTRNQYLHGGKVVFGSAYMLSDDGSKKHYITGGPNFNTTHDFKKHFDLKDMTCPA
jgi:hypothetical protein